MAAAFDPVAATVTDIEKLLREKQVSSEQLVGTYLHQIAKYNGYLHAVIATAPQEQLVQRARELDAERARGNIRGPLHGIPIILKDNTATHPDLGMDTTSGTYALKGSRVKNNASFVNQLIEAGAIILAKANLSELSNFRGLFMHTGWSAIGGMTQSAYVRGRKSFDEPWGGHSSCGGSSARSAVSVSAGFAPAAIETDSNGSILMPATRNDVYSLKPTLGSVSQDGIVPISLDFDSAGPMAKCARDVAILMDAMIDRTVAKNVPQEGYTSFLNTSWEGLRIGILEPKDWKMPPHVVPPNESADAQQEKEISAAYEKLKSLGAKVKNVVPASLDDLVVDGMSQIGRVMDSQFKRTFETYLSELEESPVRTLQETMDFMHEHSDVELPPESSNMKRLEAAMAFQITDEEYQKALADMRDWGRNRAVDKCLQENDIDIIIGPGDSRINELAVTAGYPIATLPLSYLDLNGRAFGLAAISTAHSEGLLIRLMSAWEADFSNRKLPWLLEKKTPKQKSEL